MAYKASSDRFLFFLTAGLTIFGLVMVYSASSIKASEEHGISTYYALKQLIFALAGFGMLLALMNIDYHLWQKEKIIRICLILAALGLVAALAQPKVNGAHRWLRFGGPFSFQPSEIAKLIAIIFLAAYLNKYHKEINCFWKRLVPCLAVIGVLTGLIVIEPDLGQAVCLVFIMGIMLLIAGLNWKYIASAFLCILPVFYFFVVLEPFRWQRVKSFLDPFHDRLGAGWQAIQSLTAVGSGGAMGVGLGSSNQKMFYLPEAHSDFIFAVIGEEIGLLGTVLVVLAFLFFFFRGMRATLRAPDSFGFYLGLGITLMVAVQALINISMVLAMMPTKGIALPFISQGGSSLLLNLLAAGILLNISHFAEQRTTEQ